MIDSQIDSSMQVMALSTGLEQANYQRAVEQTKKESNRYYKGNQVKWNESLPHFKMYGSGVYLYFAFLKYSTFLFLVLTVISLPPMILNGVKGVNFRKSQLSLSSILARSSLGSHSYQMMTDEDAYTKSIAYKIVNVTFDVIQCIVFLVFILYWQRKSTNMSKHISKELKLISNQTIQVIQYPPNTTQRQMEEFMGKFGSLVQVVGARDFTVQIKLSKQIYEKQMQIRQLQFIDKYQPNNNKKQQITKLKNQTQILYSELDKVSTRNHQITKFYVQFQTPQIRKKVLKKFLSHQKVFSCCTDRPQEMNISNQQVRVQACNAQPSGIIWQNVHVSWSERIPRYLFQLFVILAVMVGAFIFICFLNILAPTMQTDVDVSGYNYYTIQNSNDTIKIQAWCVKQYSLTGRQKSPYYDLCANTWTQYTNYNIITIAISIILMIFCYVLKKIVYLLAQFQRYETQTEKTLTIMTNMFVMNFLTTTLISFLMQANIFSLSVLNFLKLLITSNDLHNNILMINEYNDLVPNWYKQIGFQIWFNIFIMIFLPQVLEPFGLHILQCIKQKIAKTQKIHKNMKDWLQPFYFQIQQFYSNILLIIATGFIFGGGIQLMMVVVTLCLFVRYFYSKYIFVRFCKVPMLYNDVFNQRVVFIMKGILIIRCLISIYMYGATSVFAMEKSVFMKWASSLGVPVVSSIFVVFSRILLTWYYSMFVLVFILVLIFKQLIFKTIRNCRQPKDPLQTLQNNPNSQTLSKLKNNQQQVSNSIVQSWASNQQQEKRSQRLGLKSYRLENNPLYSEILVIMRLRENKGRDIRIESVS